MLEAIAYVAYVVPVLGLYLWGDRFFKSRSTTRQARAA